MTRTIRIPARFALAPMSGALPPVLRGFAAYCLAEAASRAVRLFSIVVVSRSISPLVLGTAALALSLFEMIRILTNVGIGQRLIAASDEALPPLLKTARRLFWIACLSVAAIQLAAAAALAIIWSQTEVAAMLAILALVYPVMPFGLPSIFLAMREKRLGATARIAATQNMADNLLTLVLALAWPSAWAIVLPKLLTAPIWAVMARHARPVLFDPQVSPAPVTQFRTFGPAILGSELLSAVRANGDNLIIGAILGTKLLGVYYFAFNAGLGITQSFVAACSIVVFPHLASAAPDDRRREFTKAFLQGLMLLGPVVALQAMLAPFYVALVFGEQWAAAAPYVALLAAGAVPLYAGSLLGAFYRAEGRPYAEMRLQCVAAVVSLALVAVGATAGLVCAMSGLVVGLAITFIPAAVRELRSTR